MGRLAEIYFSPESLTRSRGWRRRCHLQKEPILGSLNENDISRYFFQKMPSPHAVAPQHFLYFLPLPQEHGSLRPIFGVSRRTVWATGFC